MIDPPPLDGSISITKITELSKECLYRATKPIVFLPFLSVIFSYLFVVRLCRYRRRDSQGQRYGFTTREDFARMNVHEAQAIQAEYAELESPQMFFSMSRLGLLKVFGIDTISRTVLPQLKDEISSSFRAVSTSIIMSEIICNPPGSERVLDGIARMNYLHASYIKAGKISNSDMIYILSRFALEPVKYAQRYDWREMSELERCATGVFWKDLGEKMGIHYSCFPSGTQGAEGTWKDGMEWLEELDGWSREYEISVMAPSEANFKAAYWATHIASFSFPTNFLRQKFRASMSSMLEPHQVQAMGMPKPSAFHAWLVNAILFLRKFAYKNLMLPRPEFLRRVRVARSPNKHGRYYDTSYNAYPWYVPPTPSWILSPISILQWVAGGDLPTGNEKYEPQGYSIAELGPRYKKGKGLERMAEDKERIRKMMEAHAAKGTKGEGCPFI